MWQDTWRTSLGLMLLKLCGITMPRVSAAAACCMLRARQPLTILASTVQRSAAGMGSLAQQEPFQVLFCGEEFPWSYRFTKEALQDDPGFQVGSHRATLCPFHLRGTWCSEAQFCHTPCNVI